MSLAIGVNIEDGLWTVIYTYRITAPTEPSSVGMSVKLYSGKSVAEAQVEKQSSKKVGAIIEVYEPEINALFAGLV